MLCFGTKNVGEIDPWPSQIGKPWGQMVEDIFDKKTLPM
jgi:hypothetical protein